MKTFGIVIAVLGLLVTIWGGVETASPGNRFNLPAALRERPFLIVVAGLIIGAIGLFLAAVI